MSEEVPLTPVALQEPHCSTLMSKTDDFDTALQTIVTMKFVTTGMVARLGWLSWSPHAKADQPTTE